MARLHIHRRQFLGGMGGAGAAATLPSAFARDTGYALPPYADWKDADALIVHSDQTIETRRGRIGASLVTPNDEVFIRNNLPAPERSMVSDPDAWEISVEGVAVPRAITVGELKTLGFEIVAMVLQCSGNGRGFFAHDPSGTEWKTGAAACVVWSGVPVRSLAKALGGPVPGAKFMTSTGGETLPEGVDVNAVVVERSVPLEAMETAILAWQMNGEPIPLAHGGPLRIVVPGYYGVNNVKYVKRLAFTTDESQAEIQQTGYRVRPVGEKGAPSQPSMWEMAVKSWVTQPLGDVKAGRNQILGVAFGGVNAVSRVEVSIDGGKSWRQAAFAGPDLGRFAWRPFVLKAELTEGSHLIASRATDAAGRTQPEIFEPNERGYGHNGWRAHAVSVRAG